ncbi:hypothetical protein HPP92_023549 [Vanilla planifolia]|uniref:Uncharacterized protein n=1 Tax=Vanilla planifolia TaxID=51239 RepID=A0A835UE92_VANPL|nr:hypothetical protein HPP92_023549 [Vanilla planifolia]
MKENRNGKGDEEIPGRKETLAYGRQPPVVHEQYLIKHYLKLPYTRLAIQHWILLERPTKMNIENVVEINDDFEGVIVHKEGRVVQVRPTKEESQSADRRDGMATIAVCEEFTRLTTADAEQ